MDFTAMPPPRSNHVFRCRIYHGAECANMLFPYIFNYVTIQSRITAICGPNIHFVPSTRIQVLDRIFGGCTKTKLSTLKLLMTKKTLFILKSTAINIRYLMFLLEDRFIELDYYVTLDDIYLTFYMMLVPYETSFLCPFAWNFFSHLRRFYRRIEREIIERSPTYGCYPAPFRSNGHPLNQFRRSILDGHPEIQAKMYRQRPARRVSFQLDRPEPQPSTSRPATPNLNTLGVGENGHAIERIEAEYLDQNLEGGPGSSGNACNGSCGDAKSDSE